MNGSPLVVESKQKVNRETTRTTIWILIAMGRRWAGNGGREGVRDKEKRNGTRGADENARRTDVNRC